MPDPFITPLIIGGVVGALSPTTTTLKWTEIDAWIKGKRSGLKSRKGAATITREEAAGGQIIVTATVCSLEGTFSTKAVPLDSRKWTADRLDSTLKSKFRGSQPIKIKLTRPAQA